MEQRNAIVTGGLRGLGRAMAFGLAGEGHRVLAVGHIDADVAVIERQAASAGVSELLHPIVADLRRSEECDRIVAAAETSSAGSISWSTMPGSAQIGDQRSDAVCQRRARYLALDFGDIGFDMSDREPGAFTRKAQRHCPAKAAQSAGDIACAPPFETPLQTARGRTKSGHGLFGAGSRMEKRNAIVTGGLRGLGRAMALGLAREGHRVLAVGHIETDVAEIEREDPVPFTRKAQRHCPAKAAQSAGDDRIALFHSRPRSKQPVAELGSTAHARR